jgi:sulfite reductase (ferredoxin)
VGQTVDKYKIFVGGSLLGTRLNFVYKELVPTKEMVEELTPLLVYYKSDSFPGESLGDFCHRKGREELLHFDASYKELHGRVPDAFHTTTR